MSDLVSVIVPAYNAERFLSRCVDSILNQTYENIELILIDDGSVDRTGGICDGYAGSDSRVIVIHQQNRGVSAARNAGIDRSSGSYLMFVDADDALLPDSVEILLAEILLADADIAACASHRLSDGEAVPAGQSGGGRRILEGLESLENSLRGRGYTFAVWAKMFRRAFVADVRFPEGKRVHEDSFFLFECFCKQPRMLLCDRYVYVYYVTADSASRAVFSEKCFDILDLAERKLAIIEAQYPQLTEMGYNVVVKANMALLENLCRTRDPRFRQAERACIRAVRKYRKYFIPASQRNKRWFFVITHHLYYLYKVCYTVKYREK